ncbi:MAG: ATP-binding protein [Gammaproteobacteria bacterium]|nr:ATP-binding protein [Gammaproteobacteria bacterium]
MSTTMLDVTLHIDEDTTHNERENLRDAFFNMKGVMTADCRDERPHLMIVGFDPEDITTSELIETVQKQGYHAELVAM